MRAATLPAILALPLLAACAGDNPENTPLYGQWETVTEIDSLTVDGMVLPREQMPPEFTRMETTEGQCGEPYFIDQDWQQRDLNRRVQADCTLESYDVSATRVDGTGVCSLDGGEISSTPSLDIGIDQAEDSYRMVISMQGSFTLPQDGSAHTYRVIAVQEGTRTGDC